MNSEILGLAETLSDDVKDLLLINDNNGNIKIDGSNLSKALSIASTKDVNTIIKIYLRLMCESKGQWKNVGWEKIKPIEDRLVKLFDEIGIKESENPFIEFIAKLCSNNQLTLTDDNIVDLINLYAKDEISYEDLVGKGSEGKSHIIFNHDLYASEDPYKVVQIYNWLGNINNLSKMNWHEVVKAKLSNNITNVANTLAQIFDSNDSNQKIDTNNYRDFLIYKKPQSKKNIYNINTLEELLRRGSINSELSAKNRQSQENKVGLKKDLLKTLANYNDVSDAEVVRAIKDVLRGLNINL